MPKNKIDDLRNHLFEMLENLRDADEEDLATEIKKAGAVAKISQTIINTAKMEMDYLKILKTSDLPILNDFLKIEDSSKKPESEPKK